MNKDACAVPSTLIFVVLSMSFKCNKGRFCQNDDCLHCVFWRTIFTPITGYRPPPRPRPYPQATPTDQGLCWRGPGWGGGVGSLRTFLSSHAMFSFRQTNKDNHINFWKTNILFETMEYVPYIITKVVLVCHKIILIISFQEFGTWSLISLLLVT